MYVKKLSYKKEIKESLISKYLRKKKKIKHEKIYGVDFSTILLLDYFKQGVDILNNNPYALSE